MRADDLEMPGYARIDRSLGLGEHRFRALLPAVGRSPALRRICRDQACRRRLLREAQVSIRPSAGFAYIDTEARQIVLSRSYYRRGAQIDLYLDLLHELTHLRQLDEGADLWDERFAYVDRPTEIEGYAVAVEEGRRLGMSEARLVRHLSNPWMSRGDVARLLENVERFLAAAPEVERGA